MKKILLINPESPESFWSMTELCVMGRRSALVPPLGLATLAALTPAHYEVKIVDENIETIDFDTPCDLVGITGYTVHKNRVTEIASGFRKRGLLIVGGGAYCSSHPREASGIFDVVFAGEAEQVWESFLNEWEQGTNGSFYEVKENIDLRKKTSPVPRWDLVPLKKYLSGQVQTSRGCPYDCEFCDVVQLFGRKPRHKSVEQVIEEVRVLADYRVNEIFFADDNFIGNKVYAKQLLKALIRFNKSRRKPVIFMTQLTLNCADDEALLDLLRRANFLNLFIGIESPSKESLIMANKKHNINNKQQDPALDMMESVRKIQSRGMRIVCGMIVGFDSDDLKIFEIQKSFLMEAGLLFPMVGILQAFKGTRLWQRLKEENRLSGSELGDNFLATNITPKLMTKEELESNYLKFLQTVYSEDFFTRSFRSYIEQCDINEIKKGSAVLQFTNIYRSSFFYPMYGLRIFWAYMTANQCTRELFFKIMKITLGRHLLLLPVGLNALAYFRVLSIFVKRYSFVPKSEADATSSAQKNLPRKKNV